MLKTLITVSTVLLATAAFAQTGTKLSGFLEPPQDRRCRMPRHRPRRARRNMRRDIRRNRRRPRAIREAHRVIRQRPEWLRRRSTSSPTAQPGIDAGPFLCMRVSTGLIFLPVSSVISAVHQYCILPPESISVSRW